MSRYNTKVKSVEMLSGSICRIELSIERPSKTPDRTPLEETNSWIYIGTTNEWLIEDGSHLAPPEHEVLLNQASKQYILNARYSKWLKK